MSIVEQGYQHWSGNLSGRRLRWWTVARHGIQIQFRNRFLRYLLFAAWTPAFLLVCSLSIWGLVERKSKSVSGVIQYLRFMNPHVILDPKYYSPEIWRLAFGYFMHVEMMFSMILVLVVGPGLISQDLRVNALPLYFSRPLRRADYFVGKWAVIAFFIAMVTIVPTIVAYLFGVLFSLSWTAGLHELPTVMAAVAYGLIICVSAGTLMLAISAMSRNLRYVALLWLGLWLITGVISGVLEGSHHQALRRGYRTRGQTVELLHHHRPANEPFSAPPGRLGGFPAYLWEAQHHDWRPLVSLTGDMSRVGDHLLGTNRAWLRLAKLEPDSSRRIFILIRFGGPWYPWYWAAAVLAVVFVISAGILKWSIRSLDRLK